MYTAYKYKKVKQLLILVESDIFYNQLQALLLSTITTHNANTKNTNNNNSNNSTINIHKSHKNKHNTATHIHTNIHTNIHNTHNTNSNACYSHISTILLDKTRSLFQEFEIVKIDKIYKNNNYKVQQLAYNFYNSINNNNSATTSTNTVPTTLKTTILTATTTNAAVAAAPAPAVTIDTNNATDITTTNNTSTSSKMSPLVPTLPLSTTSTTSTTLSAKAPPFTSRSATASVTSLPTHAHTTATPADRETGLSFPVTATSDIITCDQVSYIDSSIAKSSCPMGTGAGTGLSFPPTALLLDNKTPPIVTPTPAPACPSPPLPLEEGMHRLALGYLGQDSSSSSRHSNNTSPASTTIPVHQLDIRQGLGQLEQRQQHHQQQQEHEQPYSARSTGNNTERSTGTVNWGYGGS